MSAGRHAFSPAFNRSGPNDAASATDDAVARFEKIGPNAITQLHAVLLQQIGASGTESIFKKADSADFLSRPPETMVDERRVARLHRQVRLDCDQAAALTLMRAAGDATGRYILAHRIPRVVARLLRWLPSSASAALLQRAIRRHAWTFAGSGLFSIEARGRGRPIVARIRANPVVALDRSDIPLCDWHAAVFRRLFRDLVDQSTEVLETDCCAKGAEACRFEIHLHGSRAHSAVA